MGKSSKYKDPSAPLWSLSYGDMVTNMLCFFVMLLMFAKFDAKDVTKAKESRALEEAFSAAFSLTPEKGAHQWLIAGGKGILLTPQKRNQSEIPRITAKVKKALQTVSARSNILILPDERKVKIRIPSKVLFQSGSAVLKPGSEEILMGLLPVISEVPNDIRIDGHCDDLPTSNPMFPTNWELSTARACTVVRFFTEKMNQDPMRFAAQGFAEYQPQVLNVSESDREMNRRVEINIMTSKQKKPPSNLWE